MSKRSPWKRLTSRRTALGRKADASRPRRLALEPLEHRVVLTSMVYLDFGDNFPAGGLDMTVGQLRGAIAGNAGIQGPDFREFAADNVTVVDYPDTLGLQFTGTAPLVTFNYNATGGVDGTDYTDLRTNVLALAQRYYNNLDCNVVIAPALDNSSDANYLQGIRDTLNLGAAADGERDCWVFVAQVIRTDTNVSVGNDKNLNGQAAGPDIGNNNARDDSAITFADQAIALDASADTRLAYTAAHEAGHTFGQRHRNNGTSGTALDADMAQLTGSELVTESAGATNRTNFVFHTRYPLIRGDNNNNPSMASPTDSFNANDVENQYTQAAANGRLGLRAGAADFVSGTGAHDQITITRTGANSASVTVQAFRDAAYTSAITVPGQATTTFSYNIDTTNGILIEGGFGTDQITVDATITEIITVRGMAGAADRLIVNGGNLASGTYTPAGTQTAGLDGNTDFRGQIVLAGGATINFEEFQTSGFVTVQNVGSLTLRTPNSADILSVSNPVAGQNQVAGSSGGVAFVPLRFTSVGSFVIDTATNDGGSPGDEVTVSSSLVATGLMNFTVNTGDGNDELIVTTSDYALPVGGGSFTYQAGAGTGDQITAAANVSFNLSDSSLAIVADGSIALSSVEQAELAGGASSNTFTVSNWTGDAELNGGGAGDSYVVNLTGAGNGFVEIDDTGGSGTDTAEVNGTVADNGLEVTSTQVSLASEAVAYDGIESLAVNGLAGDDTINVRSTTASTPVTVNGGDDDDTVNIGSLAGSLDAILGLVAVNGNAPAASDSLNINDQGDADTHDYVITSTSVDRDGAAQITYATVEILTVNGAQGGNLINVQSTVATTPVVVNAGAGGDDIRVDADGAGVFGGTVDLVVSSLTINGQGGVNAMFLEDFSDPNAVAPGDVVHVTPTRIGADPTDTFFGTGGSLTYSSLAHVTLDLSNGYFPDTVYLIPSAATEFELHGNDPDCPMEPAQLPGDALFVDFTGVTDPLLVSDGAGNSVWTFGNRQDVAFDGFEKLNHVGIVVVAPDTGSQPLVQVFDAESGALKFSFMAFDPNFHGGVRVAVAGDMNCDGIPDIIAAAGPGGGPEVRVFNGVTGLPLDGALGSFLAYDNGSHAGVWVAAGDINQDGITDIITGPDNGGGDPLVRVFSGETGALHAEFLAYEGNFQGGVRVAVGDINGDTVPDIITAPGSGRAPLVNVFDGTDLTGPAIASFLAFEENYHHGLYLAVGDVTGDGRADIIASGGSGGQRLVNLFDGTDLSAPPVASFSPYAQNGGDSIRVAAVDIDGDGDLEIVTAGGSGAERDPKVFDVELNPDEVDAYFAATIDFRRGHFVAGGG